MNKNLTKDQIDIYNRDGYLLLKNVIDYEIVEKLMDFVSHVIALEAKIEVNSCSKRELLNEKLISLKRHNPSSSSWIYQTILSSFALKTFFIEIGIAPMVMKLLKMDDERNLGTVSPAFRFDIPGDTNNVRTWHQDGNYFLENDKGHDHLVVWIPMNKATSNNGSVIIVPKSHKNGKYNAEYLKSNSFKSEQHIIPDIIHQKYNKITIEADKGDVVFLNMDLIHTSGINITKNEVRYTAQIRFNQINKKEFRPVFLKSEYPIYNRNNNQIK